MRKITKRLLKGLFLVSGSLIVLLLIFRKTCNYININTDDVVQLYYGAINEGHESIIPITNPEELMIMDTFRDTVVLDRSVITKVVSLVNSLKPSNETDHIDARIVFSIKMKDGTKHRFALGYLFGTLYNGRIMEDNDELFSFLDSLIYANHDLEYWAPSFYKEAIEQGLEPVPDNWKKKRGQRQSTLKD